MLYFHPSILQWKKATTKFRGYLYKSIWITYTLKEEQKEKKWDYSILKLIGIGASGSSPHDTFIKVKTTQDSTIKRLSFGLIKKTTTETKEK